ncbi:hypothetical protein [Marinobacter sp. AC-23]|uniref:hypothetical protein n=1 Tax=Marinobacter sp. AC-23 TaxID=1879031 RepID=UPI0009F4BB2F|nr:hypothetical protein [Marinobacter sp. AC-23]
MLSTNLAQHTVNFCLHKPCWIYEATHFNLPLPAGSGHGAYLEAMQQVVVPALRRFCPDVILVASGLDANAREPLGRMMCHSDTYREMARLIKAADFVTLFQ